MRERALTIDCEGETLLGVLHEPPAEQEASGLGVVVVVGGPQYRVGSHRQFVHLARALAAAGHVVLRADVRGMGDSTGTLLGFDQQQTDVGAFIDTLLTQCTEVHRVVLCGLCDGASSVLLYLQANPVNRVYGACLLNPWVRSDVSLARTHVKHYYVQRLAQREFWRKLVRGRVARRALSDLLNAVGASFGLTRQAAVPQGGDPSTPLSIPTPYQTRMGQAWFNPARPILLVLSSDDYTAKEFSEYIAADPHWKGALQEPHVRSISMKADHTFSSRAARLDLQCVLTDWLSQLQGRPQRIAEHHRLRNRAHP